MFMKSYLIVYDDTIERATYLNVSGEKTHYFLSSVFGRAKFEGYPHS